MINTGTTKLTMRLSSPEKLSMNLPIRTTIVEVNCHSAEWWDLRPQYIPKEGEIIIYLNRAQIHKDDKIVSVPGIKIGDGNTYVADLPFVADDIYHALMEMIETGGGVSPEDKERWDNKITCELDGEMLILTKTN